MAKTIKFNLILDNYPVRNLEGIQEHFSIEDMLNYFSNGLLLRWLDVRGYRDEFAAVNAIDSEKDVRAVIAELIRIFEVEAQAEDIEKGISILEYLEESKRLNAIYKENAFSKKQILDDYHRGYEILIRHMEEFSDNMAVLKADVIQLEREYLALFVIDYGALYLRLEKSAPKAIFAILTRDVFRDYWIGKGDPSRWRSENIYNRIKKNLLSGGRMKEILGNDLKIVRRNTQAMWDPIERPEVRLMVIAIANGTFIKNAGEFSEKLGANEINEKFVKFNGLEYQCNNENYELLYMEV